MVDMIPREKALSLLGNKFVLRRDPILSNPLKT